MKYLRYLLIALWRIWFYIIMIVTVLPLFPVLVVLTSKESYYPAFFRLAHIWGKVITRLMGFRTDVRWEQELIPGKSYMITANHTSMMDIMLMLAVFGDHPFVFVGKKELEKIPVLGYAYKKTMILVDRSSTESRKNVYFEAEKKIKRGLSVFIFPEGMVPDDRSVVLAKFKKGAFLLAIEHGIPIVPVSILDNKKRFSYDFFSGGPGRLRVIVHKPVETAGMDVKKDREKLTQKVYDIIYRDLTEIN